MALSGVEYLIAIMSAFPLFFVVLVLFLFGEMTRNVITRTELLPLPSATFMVEEGPSHGRGGSFPWPRGGPSLDRVLGPTQILTWASQFYTPPQIPSYFYAGIVTRWHFLKIIFFWVLGIEFYYFIV